MERRWRPEDSPEFEQETTFIWPEDGFGAVDSSENEYETYVSPRLREQLEQLQDAPESDPLSPPTPTSNSVLMLLRAVSRYEPSTRYDERARGLYRCVLALDPENRHAREGLELQELFRRVRERDLRLMSAGPPARRGSVCSSAFETNRRRH